MLNGKRLCALDRAALLACAAILGYQLLLPPVVGLANNGDFGEAVGLFSLGAPLDDEYKYAPLKYAFNQRYFSRPPFPSPETLLAAAAIGLNRIFSKSGSFDMRWMGVVHGALFLLALYLFLPLLSEMRVSRRAIWSGAVLFVFCDVMYVSYFNSFYMDAAAFLFLALSVVFFLRAMKWRRSFDAVGLLACAILLILSKVQHAVMGAWVAALLALCGAQLWSGRRGFSIIPAVLAIAAAVFEFRATPREYTAIGPYTVVFLQVLPHSRDVPGDLRALGLDDSYRRWIGTFSYSEGSPMSDLAFARAFAQKVPYSKLGWYFLTHPRNAYRAIRASVDLGARQRSGMGNFDKSAGLPPFAESRAVTLWSDAKRALFYHHPQRYLAFYLLLVAAVCGLATAQRHERPLAAVVGAYALSGMAITALLVASLGDAADVPRHHFLANALFDLLLLVGGGFLTHGKGQRA